MPDPLHIRSERQPEFEELREQYREANRQRIHRMLREDTITFRDKDGDYLLDSEGKIVVKKTGYLTDAPPGHEHRRLDEYIQSGGLIPEVELQTQALAEGQNIDVFDIPECAGLGRELRDLERDAALMEKHEQVRYEKEEE